MGIQREKRSDRKLKIEAEARLKRAGDFGKVAEIRTERIVEAEKKLRLFPKSQLAQMQAGISFA